MSCVCRERAEREGFANRCVFHVGYLDTLPADGGFDAATCFLVSQFILDRDERSDFFAGIAKLLRPAGLLISSDLASGSGAEEFETLLRSWLSVMAGPTVSEERLEGARAAYERNVAVLPPAVIASVIEAGGFDAPVQIFQAGMLHAWCSRVGG